MRRCPLLLAGVLVLALAVPTWAAVEALRRPGPAASPATTAALAAPPRTRALRVLHRWDRRRAQAWSRGSVRQLGSLYARRCEARAADRAMLAAYRVRGLRVVDMRRQTWEVHEVRASGGRLTVRVTDRLVHAVAVGHGIRQPLPSDGYTSQTLTFRRTARGWVRVG